MIRSLALFCVVMTLIATAWNQSKELKGVQSQPGGISENAALLAPSDSLNGTDNLKAPATQAPSIPVGNKINGVAKPPARSVVSGTVPVLGGRREWDSEFLSSLGEPRVNESIQFELVDGEWATGKISHLEHRDGVVIRVDGRITSPTNGRFFFQKQARPGKAGDYVGVVELPARNKGYRIEPSRIQGQSELVEHSLEEVVCIRLPMAPVNHPSQTAQEIPPLDPNAFPTIPIPDYQAGIIPLESLPGAIAVLYLDYRGGFTPTWGGITYEKPKASNREIRDVWKRVAEDFMPFHINVTTDEMVFKNAPEGKRQRVIVTPTTKAAPGAGGVAFIGSFNWTGDSPCWSFNVVGKSASEAISHEFGHTLGLSHDGKDVGGVHTEYYEGHGVDAQGWVPIMGVGYDKNVSQWSKGEYASANNTQDDLEIVTSQNNDVGYRVDDTADRLGSARYLELLANRTVKSEGVIERTGDTDAYRFSTTGGSVSLRVDPVGDWANLAIHASLYDANDTFIYASNPQTSLFANVVRTVAAGTYTLRVKGTARRNVLTDGFSEYGSLGYYKISGSIAGGLPPTRFSIPENSPSAKIVGVVALENPSVAPLIYRIDSGNLGGAFEIDPQGQLSVANPSMIDYETLGLSSQQVVQFELFVTITDASNNTVLETNRRVVVGVTDVNEAPVLSQFSTSLFEHTQVGIVVGQVKAVDPDFRNALLFSITSGDTNGMFSIGSQSGEIKVVGDLNAEAQNSYQISLRVTDQAVPVALVSTSIVNITIMPTPGFLRPGTLNYSVYTNMTGTALVDMTRMTTFYPNDPAFEKPVFLFEADADRGDDYGSVLRGYIIAPATGSYRFWIATDDSGELWMSVTTNRSSITRIATVTGAVGPREWTKYPTQQSGLRSLVAGQAYYVEARMKEGGGNDHMAVAWECQSAGISQEVIPGRFLAPANLNYTPRAQGITSALHRDAILGSRVGVIGATDVNPNDRLTFSISSGNTEGLFALNPTNGILRVANETTLVSTTQKTFNLLVRVNDNGSPSRSRLTTNLITLATNGAITTTTLRQEIWTNIGTGNAVVDLTKQTKYPKRPDLLREITSFESGEDFAESYGSRIRAILKPSVSGFYTFYIASDDAGSLKYGTTNSPGTAAQITSVSGSTDYQNWTDYPSQKSSPLTLTAGRPIYLEALHKEGVGGDHVSVAWTSPTITTPTVIQEFFLAPVDINHPPELSGKTTQIYYTATNGLSVTTLVAKDSPIDSVAYKILDGNQKGIFSLDTETGAIRLVDHNALAAHHPPVFNLLVQAQDSGYGDLYPRKSTNVAVQIQIIEPSALTWTGSGTHQWSDRLSWSGAPPLDGTGLIFSGTQNQTNLNDLFENVGAVTIKNGGFQISGQAVTLRAGFASIGDNTWDIGTKLLFPQTNVNESGTLTWSGPIDNNGHPLTFHVKAAVEVTGSLSGSGDLIKTGSGKLTLAGTNLFHGETRVASGTLVLRNQSALPEETKLHLESGTELDVITAENEFDLGVAQTLSGIGSVKGNIKIKGTLAPGYPVGRVSFSNNLTLAGITLIDINKNAGNLLSDQVMVGERLTLGGQLIVTNLGSALTVGDTFKIFDAKITQGEFDLSLLNPPGDGLSWDFQTLATTGELKVRSGAPVRLNSPQLNGNQLEFSVASTVGMSYVLETTQQFSDPISWIPVATNIGTGQLYFFSIPLELEKRHQFYRLMSQ